MGGTSKEEFKKYLAKRNAYKEWKMEHPRIYDPDTALSIISSIWGALPEETKERIRERRPKENIEHIVKMRKALSVLRYDEEGNLRT